MSLFEGSVGVDLDGDLTALTESEAASVREFASGVAGDVEAAVGESTEVSVTVTCLYRLSDASRLDLLTLNQECVAPRRLDDHQRALQAGANGFGVILIFREPVEEVSIEEVVISIEHEGSPVSVRAEATTVLASPPAGSGEDLPDFQANVKRAPPEEDSIISSGLAAVTAGGMLIHSIF